MVPEVVVQQGWHALGHRADVRFLVRVRLVVRVVGVDPATIHPQIAEHEQFTHWKKRARDVRIKDFGDFDWILTDMNIDPASTMASLERILSSRPHKPRGIIATLKLSDLSHAEELDKWSSSCASWGYQTRVKQLSTGAQVCCGVSIRRRPASSMPLQIPDNVVARLSDCDVDPSFSYSYRTSKSLIDV